MPTFGTTTLLNATPYDPNISGELADQSVAQAAHFMAPGPGQRH